MTNLHRIPDIDTVKDEASRWIIRLHSGDASSQDAAEFEAWRNAHPLHARTYDELLETWRECTAAGPMIRAVSFANSMSESRKPERSLRRIWLAAASLAMLGVLGVVFYAFQLSSGRSFGTAVGERATIVLVDGSVMQLNSNSVARVAFARESRVIHLDRGEAYFEVAHDVDRPFWVVGGKSWVRAVGTAFNVYVRPSDVQVTVSEGRVKVGVAAASLGNSPSDQQLAKTMVSVLDAGQQANIGGVKTMTHRLSSAQLARFTSWRNGSLYFEDAALREVVEELNRYTNKQLVLQDDSLQDLAVGGAFDASPQGVESLLGVLEQGFGLRVRREQERIFIENTKL